MRSLAVARENGWFVLFIWSVWFVWLNQIDQISQSRPSRGVKEYSRPFSFR